MTANDNKITELGFGFFFAPSPAFKEKLAPLTPDEVQQVLERRYGPDLAQFVADHLRKGRV